MNPIRMSACIALLASAWPALGYVGPGAGLSVLGALWGLLIAIVAAMFFIIAWPVRRMLRRRRQESAVEQGGGAEPPGADWHADPSATIHEAADPAPGAPGTPRAPTTGRPGG